MATITSAQTGDFSDTATWVGGVVPTVGDIAVAANGHVVAIDTDVTLTRVTQLGTGKFTLGGGRTLTAEVQAVSGSFTSGGTVEVTATSGSTAYIIGNVTGLSSTAVNICGVNVTGTGTLQLTGNVTGSPGSVTEANGHAGVYINSSATVEITGQLDGGTGGAKRALQVGTSGVNATVIINGNVLGGTTSNCLGILIQASSCTFQITGNVTGGIGQNAEAIQSTTSPVITITGNVTAGARHGVFITGVSPSVTVVGNATAGNATNNIAVYCSGASAIITITGNVIGAAGTNAVYAAGATSFIDVVGNATAGGTSGHAIRSDATSAGFGVRFSGETTDTQSGVRAIYTRFFRVVSTAPSGVVRYANDASFPTGGTVSRVSPDNVTGMPATNNVRSGLTYGYNDELSGTLAMPNSGSVALGVPVDDTTGVAVLTQEAIWNYLASSATTPNSLGAILANIVSLLREDAIEQIITYNRDLNNTLSISGSTDYRTFNINTSGEALPIVSFGEEVL
jgi:hypothetical protein